MSAALLHNFYCRTSKLLLHSSLSLLWSITTTSKRLSAVTQRSLQRWLVLLSYGTNTKAYTNKHRFKRAAYTSIIYGIVLRSMPLQCAHYVMTT